MPSEVPLSRAPRGTSGKFASRETAECHGASFEDGMNVDSEWEFAGATPDGQSLEIGGLDVWKHSGRTQKIGRAFKNLMGCKPINIEIKKASLRTPFV